MADIDLNSLCYYKTEIDTIHSTESARVDSELALKSDKSDEGSPSGLATLDPSGKHVTTQIPFATLEQSGDDTNNTTLMTPERTIYQIGQLAVSEGQIGVANGVAPLGADSLVPDAYLPPARVVKTYVVETLQDMYNLKVTNDIFEGDRAVVTNDPSDVGGNINGEYVATVDYPLDNEWQHLPNLSAVSSVNGSTGDVVITSITESASNASAITALDGRVTVNEADILAAEGNITTLQSDVSTNATNIALKADQTSLDTTNGNVTTNAGNIADHETRIAHLEGGHNLLIHGSSTASSQQPTGLDTPLQVEFGALQDVTDVTLAADGTITFKTTGTYIVNIGAQYGRTGGTGASVLLFRWLKNDVQYGHTNASIIDNSDINIPWSSSTIIEATANDVFKTQIVRDSGGNDSGGLFAVTPTIAGWNQAPSASISIYMIK